MVCGTWFLNYFHNILRPTLSWPRDTGEKTFRHELYDDYKANRTEVPEDLIPQFDIIHELVECMQLANQKKIGFEADDIIGTNLYSSGKMTLMKF